MKRAVPNVTLADIQSANFFFLIPFLYQNCKKGDFFI